VAPLSTTVRRSRSLTACHSWRSRDETQCARGSARWRQGPRGRRPIAAKTTAGEVWRATRSRYPQQHYVTGPITKIVFPNGSLKSNVLAPHDSLCGARLTEVFPMAGSPSLCNTAAFIRLFSYLLGTYSIAAVPESNSTRLTSLRSTTFDSPASNVGP